METEIIHRAPNVMKNLCRLAILISISSPGAFSQSWSSIGSGLNHWANAPTVYNEELIVGGSFAYTGGLLLNSIARWDGTTWTDVSEGTNGIVAARIVYNNKLIAGGYFTDAEGLKVNYIGQWDGSGWAPLGSGMGATTVGYDYVFAMGVYNGNLFAGGMYLSAGGVTANGMAKWNEVPASVPAAGAMPAHSRLCPTYPSPFNPTTNINYRIEGREHASLKVYDVLGEEVAILVDELKPQGTIVSTWDASRLPSRLYFCRLVAGGFTEMRKPVSISRDVSDSGKFLL